MGLVSSSKGLNSTVFLAERSDITSVFGLGSGGGGSVSYEINEKGQTVNMVEVDDNGRTTTLPSP
jgi:hypothetical protein